VRVRIQLNSLLEQIQLMHAAQPGGEIDGEIGDEIHVFYVIFVHLARLVSLDHL